MDRSRRQGAKETEAPPTGARLVSRPRPNRRKPGSVWSRLPKPAVLVDACGRALRRSVPALAGAAVLATVGGTAWAGYRFVTTSPRFEITEIAVRGTHHLTPDQVRAALPMHVGDNAFATNLGNVIGALRANPWIAGASAHRVLPHTIVVDVSEHSPVALANLDGLYLVDAQGQPFKRAALEADEGAGLPTITGLDRAGYLADPAATAALVRGALAALELWRSQADRPAIGEVHVDHHGALTLHTYDLATAIQLGPQGPDLAARMQTFDLTWAELTETERTHARAIHLDARPDHVTVAFSKD